MSKNRAVLLLLPLIALTAFSVASVGAQKNGANGGGSVDNCKSLTVSQWSSYAPTTGVLTQTIYIACAGNPISGAPIGWFVQYNGNAVHLTSTGTFSGGGATFTVSSINLATGSNGIAQVSLSASIPNTSYSVWGYPVCKRC